MSPCRSPAKIEKEEKKEGIGRYLSDPLRQTVRMNTIDIIMTVLGVGAWLCAVGLIDALCAVRRREQPVPARVRRTVYR